MLGGCRRLGKVGVCPLVCSNVAWRPTDVVLQLKSTRLADYGTHGSPRAVAAANGLGRSPSEELLVLLLAQTSKLFLFTVQILFSSYGDGNSNGEHATMLGVLRLMVLVASLGRC